MPLVPVRIVDIYERETRLFSRDDLIDLEGRTRIFPETRSLSAVELREAIAGIELRALGLVGYLPLTPGIVLNLRPKFPVNNLWRMLTLADETYDRVLPVLRAYERVNASAPHQLLARGFCHYLREILCIGIARGYFREPYEGPFKSKINFGRTVAQFLSRGDEVNVTGDLFVFSMNSHVNAVLKSACIDFLSVIPRSKSWEDERSLLFEALDNLYRVNAREMHLGEQELARSMPIWVRDHYWGALSAYGLFLGHSKIGFSYEAQGSELPSFLFSLDAIFESFVRNSLREGLRSANFSVVDGNKPKHQKPLFRDNKKYPIKPDAVIRRGDDTVCISEVKYKPKIDEADRYQVISHVLASDAPLGLWISPANPGQQNSLEYIGAMSTGAKFYHYKIDISGDLDVSRSELVTDLVELLNPH